MTPGPLGGTPERVTFAVAVVILLGLAGGIGYLWIQPREPAIVTVEQVGPLRSSGTQRYVTGEVRNSGDETAEAVQVVAEVTVDGEVVAEGEQLVDFLSGGETEEVVFVFDDGGSPNVEPELRVASYTVP